MLEDNFIKERNHYDGLKDQLGYDTVFDMDLQGTARPRVSWPGWWRSTCGGTGT